MILVLIQIAYAHVCHQKLDHILKSELIPRINSFNSEGKGLDYLGGYPECFSNNLTYAAIFWKKSYLPQASFGFCIPNGCEKEDYDQVLQKLSSDYNLPEQISSSSMSIKYINFAVTKPMPKAAYFFIVSFCVLMLFEIVGTFYCLFDNSDGLLKQFSIFNNFKSLVSGPSTSGNLDTLDGVRALTSITVVLLHSFFFELFFAVEDRLEYNGTFNSLKFTFMINLGHAIDVFFMLSGFLMSYLTIREIQSRQNDFSWVKFIARRITRLLPIFYFLIGFERTTYGGNPPSAQLVISHVVNLEPDSPWWTSLILIHNLLPVDSSLYLGWSWTTSIDFQFYLMSIIILYLYHKNKNWGYSVAVVYLTGCLVYSTILGITFNLIPTPFDSVLNLKQANLVYIRPLPRYPAFLIGLVLGLIFNNANTAKSQVSVAYKFKDSISERFEKYCIQMVKSNFRFAFYILGWVFVSFSMLGNHYLVVNDPETIPIQVKAVWVAFQRFIFTLGFSFLVFPLLFGYNKVTSWILRMRIFNFIAKISYALYLFHPLVYVVVYMMGNDMHRYSPWNIFHYFAGLLLISVIVSSILQVLIESPFLNLAKRYLGR